MSHTAGNTIQDVVVQIFRDKLEVEVPSSATDLLETGILDSLKFVDLLYSLEQEFGVIISMELLEVEQFRTIAEIALLVVRLQSPETDSSRVSST